MTNFTDHPDAMFAVDAPILAATQLEKRDNLVAVTEGDPTAPRIMPAALNMATNSFAADVATGATVTVTMNRYTFFPTFSRETGGNEYEAEFLFAKTSSTSLDAPKIRLRHDGTITRQLRVNWEYLTA